MENPNISELIFGLQENQQRNGNDSSELDASLSNKFHIEKEKIRIETQYLLTEQIVALWNNDVTSSVL